VCAPGCIFSGAGERAAATATEESVLEGDDIYMRGERRSAYRSREAKMERRDDKRSQVVIRLRSNTNGGKAVQRSAHVRET